MEKNQNSQNEVLFEEPKLEAVTFTDSSILADSSRDCGCGYFDQVS